MNSFIKYWNKRLRPKPQLSYSARSAKRHRYTGPKRFDRSCRNHGACMYCAGGRQHAKARQAPIPEWDLVGFEDMEEWEGSERGVCQYIDEMGYYEWAEWKLYDDRISYDSYFDDPYYHDYDEWDDDPCDMWSPYEEDHIVEIIGNRLNTKESI